MKGNLCLARVAGTLQRRWRGIWDPGWIRGFAAKSVLSDRGQFVSRQ